MTNIQYWRLAPVLLSAFLLTLIPSGFAQEMNEAALSQPDIISVSEGYKMEIEGVILDRQSDRLLLRSFGSSLYEVTVTGDVEIKEKKSNPFRGAKTYSRADLVPGLKVEVKGVGRSSGALAARQIRLRNDDLILAQTMDTRVVPVENSLKDTQARLNETEQNAQRLSGQIEELSELSNAARSGAKAAQESADNAMLAADNAQLTADNARVGVDAANERITSLDNYDVKNIATVYFKAGEATLSEEDKSKLENLADQVQNEKGFLVEVTGFASSDGDEEFNRRLSQKRADAVIQYLAKNKSIPLRRFIMPMGYGEMHPVADNSTREGRSENRRVEVRILVSKGLPPSSESTPSISSMNVSTPDQQ